jgi:hypothetical protein
MSMPPPGSAIPPQLLTEYHRLLGLYYQAMNSGNTAYAQQLVQQMRGLIASQGPSLADTVRQMLQALQPLVRPALLAAGAAWSTITMIGAEVGAFCAGFAAAIPAMLPMMLAVLLLVLLFWWMWHRQREEWRAAGYPQAMHTPEDGFPANAPMAADFQRAVRAPLVGPLEVIEGRAEAYAVG